MEYLALMSIGTWQIVLASLAGLLAIGAGVLGFVKSKSDGASDQAWRDSQTRLSERVLAQSGGQEELTKLIREQAQAMRADLPADPEEFAIALINQLPNQKNRLDALATASDKKLSELRLEWEPVYSYTLNLLEESLNAVKEQGIAVDIRKADPSPPMFEALDDWKGGANPKHVALVAHFEAAKVEFTVHPGAVIKGELTRFSQLMIRGDWHSGAGEPFLQFSVHRDKSDYMITTDGISRSHHRADSSEDGYKDDLNDSIDQSIKAAISYASLANGR